MKKLLAGTLLFAGIFLAGNVFCATYDFTGTWNYTLSGSWAQGDTGCAPGPDASGTCIISQSGDTFTFAFTSGVVCSPPESCTFEGTVDGAVYTCSTTDIVDDEGGTATSNIVFTASSATAASGSGNSRYNHPSQEWTCGWGNNITLTKPEGGAQPLQYTLTVNTVGSGTVTLSPAGGIYDPGTIVQLTAVADPGWQFYAWTGDVAKVNAASTTVVMDADKTVTATFVASGAVITGGPADDARLALFEGAFQGAPTSMAAPGDAPAVFPFGLIDFTIGGLTQGASVNVVLTMPGPISAGAGYYKYQNGAYIQYDNVAGLDDGDSSFTLTLTDGGPGDADGVVNGQIADPGGPGLLNAASTPAGVMITEQLWIGAVIHTEDKGPIEGVWQLGGQDTTARGDRVIWGHFYADPALMSWGSQNNPDLFVKIWMDVSGPVYVDYFHVSVPEIAVYTDFAYDGTPDQQGRATMTDRFVEHYRGGDGISGSRIQAEDGQPPSGYAASGNPVATQLANNLRIGAVIKTDDKGPIDGLWRLGGQDTTASGSQVVWGYFYADPAVMSWGSQNNPDLFVKVWFDVSGPVYVDFFHVSVPDIEVYSGRSGASGYEKQGTTVLANRFVEHSF